MIKQRSRQEIWNDLVWVGGAQVSPEYGHGYVLISRSFFEEMHYAMTPSFWERLWARVKRCVN
jgi:hypothetical protein